MGGRETKILKEGGTGSRDRCLKKEGGWNLLTNYVNTLVLNSDREINKYQNIFSIHV